MPCMKSYVLFEHLHLSELHAKSNNLTIFITILVIKMLHLTSPWELEGLCIIRDLQRLSLIQWVDIRSFTYLKDCQKLCCIWNLKTNVSCTLEAHTNQDVGVLGEH